MYIVITHCSKTNGQSYGCLLNSEVSIIWFVCLLNDVKYINTINFLKVNRNHYFPIHSNGNLHETDVSIICDYLRENQISNIS